MPGRRLLLRGWLLAAIVSSAAGLIAWGGTGSRTPAGSAAGATPVAAVKAKATGGCAGPGKAGDSTVRVVVGGSVRTARLHVPRAALGHPAPLLMAFHGTGGSGRFMEGYSGLTTQLNAGGAIGLFPDALGRRWHLDDDPDDVSTTGDVAFVRALLDAVERQTCVDTRRVWAAGVSNGGGFTARLACVMAPRLAAVAVVAGGFSTLPACRPPRPVAVLEIHGTADPVVPYEGREEDGNKGSVLAWLEDWVEVDRCVKQPRSTAWSSRVVRLDWTSCSGGAAVSHLRIAGGMHQWPGATPPDRGPQVGLSAAQEIWRFLQDKRLPA